LRRFVSERRGRALDLYLLLHAIASTEPWDASLSASVWARLLGLSGQSANSLVSRNWRWLADQRLVSTARQARGLRVTLLREDGSGEPYTHPGAPQEDPAGGDRRSEGYYFKLPHVYFAGAYPDRLGVPAKAALLIALSLQDDFILPLDRAPLWYGLSRDAMKKGLGDLRTLGLLAFRTERKRAPLSPLGYTEQRRYRLLAPFRE